jgi:hypothetical protein
MLAFLSLWKNNLRKQFKEFILAHDFRGFSHGKQATLLLRLCS